MRKLKSRLLKYLVVSIFLISSIFPAFTANAAIDASATALSDTQIKLQWSWTPGAVTCSIYRDGAATPVKVVNINTDRDYLSFTDSGLKPQTQYAYKLEMRNASNAIVDTKELTAKTLAITKPAITSAVFNVNNTGEKQHAITLKWTNGSASATGAIIKRSDGITAATLSSLTGYTAGGVVTYTFTDTIVAYKQTLQYTVISTDSQGHTSSPSSPASVIPIQSPEISAVMKNGIATISWADRTGIENFQLERSKYGSTSWGSWGKLNVTITAGAANASDTIADAGSYRYRLTAIPTGKYTGTGNISEPVLKLIAPSNLVCAYTDTNKVKLAWTNDPNNEGVIKVEKRIGSGSFTEIASLAKNTSVYTDTGSFSSSQTYYYRVTAYDNANNTAVGNTSSISFSKPISPTGLKAAIVSSRNLIISWEDKSDNETSFNIERKTGSGSFKEIATTGPNVTRYSDTDISSGGTYTYRVRAYNPMGYSVSYTGEVTATASSTAAPSSLALKPVSSTRIDLSWSYSGSNSSKTVIERKAAADGAWSEMAEIAANIGNYSDTGLKENRIYYYRVKALVDTNIYSESYPNDANGKSAYTKLAAPDHLTATSAEDGDIYLEWSDNSSETDFIVERKSGNDDYSVVATLSANKESWTDTGTTLGDTYEYRVQAITDNNESDYSEEVAVTASLLGAPASLDADEDNDGGVELTWKDKSDNESGFEIWRKEGSSGTWEKYDTVSRNKRRYTDEDIESGTRYYYKVRAYISSDDTVSEFSNEVDIKVEKLEAPADLEANSVSDTQIRLKWADNSKSETGFCIERKEDGGSYAEIGRIDKNSATYMDKDLKADTQYYYQIRAYDESNYSDYSDEVDAVTRTKVEFQDLVSVSWARPAVENMAARGIINGIGNGKYAPVDTMTRAQFVSILIRAFDLGDHTTSDTFSDVKSGKWYYKELMAAKALDIIEPDSSNNFYPEEPITREDIAVIICKTLEAADKELDKADTDILDAFTDRDNISDYALQSVADVYDAEIMVGNGNGTLTPKSTATRAQAAVIISRIIDR